MTIKLALRLALIALTLSIQAAFATSAFATNPYWWQPTYGRITDTSQAQWAYAASTEQRVPAFRWTAAGWQSTTFESGASVWSHPWGGGWRWAYRDGTWFALRTSNQLPWTCTGTTASFTTTHPSMTHRYPSLASTQLGYVGRGVSVRLACGNTFSNAVLDQPGIPRCAALMPGCWPEQFVLVWASPKPACAFNNLVDPTCLPAEGPARLVYLPVRAFAPAG